MGIELTDGKGNKCWNPLTLLTTVTYPSLILLTLGRFNKKAFDLVN